MPIVPPPPTTPQLTTPGERVQVSSASIGPCPLGPFDANYFLDIIRKTLPEEYVDGLEHAGGFEYLQMLADTGARLSVAVSRFECGNYITWAPTGQKATGIVHLYRSAATYGAGIVKAGTVVGTSRGQVVKFITLQDVLFGPTDLGPFATPIEAQYPGFEYNVVGEVVTLAGEIIPGSIDTLYALNSTPEFFDPTITPRQVADTKDGVAELLEQQGLDRQIVRGPREDLEDFRGRIKQVPDSVSPAALLRVLSHYLHSLGPTYDGALIETWMVSYQTCYDGPTKSGGAYDANCFVYDDPRPPLPYRNRWLSEDGRNGGEFVVLVPLLPCLQEFGIFADDPGTEPSDFTTPSTYEGRRGYSVADLPDSYPDAIQPTAFDGYDAQGRSAYGGLYDLINQLRLGGVTVHFALIGT